MLHFLNAKTVLETVGNFLEGFFNPELTGYTNFEFGEGGVKLQVAIFGIFAGGLLASFCMIFIKTTLGKMVRALLEREALSPESAVTLEACGLGRHIFIRRALKRNYMFRRVVHCVELENIANSEGGGEKNLPDLAERHYYIPEKDKYAVAMRFNEKGSGYGTFFFVLLGCAISICLIFAFLPQLITFFDNVISLFSWRGNLAR